MLVSEDYQTAYLVELKTDEKSVRDRQNEDLNICGGLLLYDILEEVLQIIKRTDERKKYMHLLKAMECNGLMYVPKSVYDLAFSSNSQGIKAALEGVMINPDLRDCQIKVVYVRPLENSSCTTISFEMLHQVVSRYDDPISLGFAEHLLKWRGQAGAKLPGCTEGVSI